MCTSTFNGLPLNDVCDETILDMIKNGRKSQSGNSLFLKIPVFDFWKWNFGPFLFFLEFSYFGFVYILINNLIILSSLNHLRHLLCSCKSQFGKSVIKSRNSISIPNTGPHTYYKSHDGRKYDLDYFVRS